MNTCQYDKCGIEFDPIALGREKFCSLRCSNRASAQAYRQRASAKIRQERPCAVCEKPFSPSKSVTEVCSARCRRALNRGKVVCVCENNRCLKEFIVWGAKRKYCSSKCAHFVCNQRFIAKTHNPTTVNCLHCNAEFTVSHEHRLYCSEECKALSYAKPLYHKNCKMCDDPFETHREEKVFCCEECRVFYRDNFKKKGIECVPTDLTPQSEKINVIAAKPCAFCKALFSKEGQFCSDYCTNAKRCTRCENAFVGESSYCSEYCASNETNTEHVKCVSTKCGNKAKIVRRELPDETIEIVLGAPEGWTVISNDLSVIMCNECTIALAEKIKTEDAEKAARTRAPVVSKPAAPGWMDELNTSKAVKAVEMVRLFRTGNYTRNQLSEMFGCSYGAVKAILKGRAFAKATGIQYQPLAKENLSDEQSDYSAE